jgi:predicted negative regulator of RcsB-dependent stress response
MALALLGSACAYFNGLYNANRLADEARQAESQGRRGEARSLWLQAAAKADSVASRYPESKYFDDALLMSGLAHSRVGECPDAIPPLQNAVSSSTDSSVVAQARILLGRCQLETGEFESVPSTVGPVADHLDPRWAEEARTLRGRAVLASGDAPRALVDLERTEDSLALADLAAALIATNQLTRAYDVLSFALRFEYENPKWSELIARLAERDPDLAREIVDEWVEGGVLESGPIGRLLIDEGDRWAERDSVELASSRYRQATATAGDSPLADEARHRLAELQLQAASDVSSVAELAEQFSQLSGRRAVRVTSLLQDAAIAFRNPMTDDLTRFHHAEAVRDSLGATALSSAMFLQLVTDNPGSVLAPKALLAVALMEPLKADSIRGVLLKDYPDSPYTQLVTGGPGAGFSAVEDSLRRVSGGEWPDTSRTSGRRDSRPWRLR